jgi:hypothetical protein
MSDDDNRTHPVEPSAAEASRLLAQRIARADVVAHGSVPFRSPGPEPEPERRRSRRLVVGIVLAVAAVLALVVVLVVAMA